MRRFMVLPWPLLKIGRQQIIREEQRSHLCESSGLCKQAQGIQCLKFIWVFRCVGWKFPRFPLCAVPLTPLAPAVLSPYFAAARACHFRLNQTLCDHFCNCPFIPLSNDDDTTKSKFWSPALKAMVQSGIPVAVLMLKPVGFHWIPRGVFEVLSPTPSITWYGEGFLNDILGSCAGSSKVGRKDSGGDR